MHLAFIQAFADAQKLIDNVRPQFAGNNHVVWQKLLNASLYLGSEQRKLFEAYFAEEGVAA